MLSTLELFFLAFTRQTTDWHDRHEPDDYVAIVFTQEPPCGRCIQQRLDYK